MGGGGGEGGRKCDCDGTNTTYLLVPLPWIFALFQKKRLCSESMIDVDATRPQAGPITPMAMAVAVVVVVLIVALIGNITYSSTPAIQ